MILRFACNYTDGKRAEAEVEFDAAGKGIIRRADDSYIRSALEEALATPIQCEVSEYRDGALATGPAVAQPGTPLHAMAMGGSRTLLAKGIQMIAIEGKPLEV